MKNKEPSFVEVVELPRAYLVPSVRPPDQQLESEEETSDDTGTGETDEESTAQSLRSELSPATDQESNEGREDSEDEENTDHDSEDDSGDNDRDTSPPPQDYPDREPDRNPSIEPTDDLFLKPKDAFFYALTDDADATKESSKARFRKRFQSLKDYFSSYTRSDPRSTAYFLASYAVTGRDDLTLFATKQDVQELIGKPFSEIANHKHKPADEDAAFTLQLRNVMRDNKFDRKLSGRRRGILDGNMLYKVPTEDFKVFQKKESRKNKDYHFTLLVDQSGSMDGTRARQASHLAVSLLKAFEACDVQYSVYGYSNCTAPYKRFHQKIDPDVLYSLLHNGHGNNNEYPAVADAYKSFPERNRQKNFVLLLSDGGIHVSQQEKLRAFVRENASTATLVGIGIGDAEPMPFCDIQILKETVAKAKPELLKVIRQSIRRG